MCLSLIQENVGLYSSYFIEKEVEDTELDIIIPQKRIPNWSEKMDALLNDSGDYTSIGEDGANMQEVNVTGIKSIRFQVENDSDSQSNASSSNAEEESADEISSDSNEGEMSDDDDEDDEAESSNSSSDSDSENISQESDSENDKR